MTFPGSIWPLRKWSGTAVLGLAVTFAPQARAHGELELRLAAATRQIAAATNHLAELYLHRGELHREHRDWDAAKADYDRAAQLNPTLSVDFCRAKMESDAGQWEAARTLFDQVLARLPDHGEAWVGRARVLEKLGERAAAIANYERGLEYLTTPEPEYFLELAQALISVGRTEDALHFLDQGSQKLGPIVLLQKRAFDLALEQKNTNAALARLDVIIAQAPRPENWLAQRGEILAAVGRKPEARHSYQSSLAAIQRLPRLLQQGPPLQKLQTKIRMALAELGEN